MIMALCLTLSPVSFKHHQILFTITQLDPRRLTPALTPGSPNSSMVIG